MGLEKVPELEKVLVLVPDRELEMERRLVRHRRPSLRRHHHHQMLGLARRVLVTEQH